MHTMQYTSNALNVTLRHHMLECVPLMIFMS